MATSISDAARAAPVEGKLDVAVIGARNGRSTIIATMQERGYCELAKTPVPDTVRTITQLEQTI